MLPISLTLSNFLSYRDDAPTLHLDGVRLACLCGPNAMRLGANCSAGVS